MKNLILTRDEDAYRIGDITTDFKGVLVCYNEQGNPSGIIIYNSSEYLWEYCSNIDIYSAQYADSLHELIDDFDIHHIKVLEFE